MLTGGGGAHSPSQAVTLNNVSSILTQFLIRFQIAIWSHFSVLCAISGFKTSFFFYDLIPDHAPPGTWGNLVSLFLSSRANGKKKFELQIPHCSVSLADRNHDLTFSSSTQQRKGFFFFSSHALDARTCRHTHPSAWISINCSRTM